MTSDYLYKMKSRSISDMLGRARGADDLSSISSGASGSEGQCKSEVDVLEADVARAEFELYGAKAALKRAQVTEALVEAKAREARIGHALSVDDVKRYEEECGGGVWRKRSDAEKSARDQMKCTGRKLRSADRQLWRAQVQLKRAEANERIAHRALAGAQWTLVAWWTNRSEQEWSDSPPVMGMTLELITAVP
jgi:hypothetical protein